jgi:hypothetical protein
VLGGGAAGPGKTVCLIHDPIEQVFIEHKRTTLRRDHPHYLEPGSSTGHALYLRRTYKQLGPTLRKVHRIFPRLDPGVRWNGEDHIFTFSSGYTYQFGHCFKPGDWENYQGFELSYLAFDELTQFMQEQYDQIRRCVRSSDPILSLMCKVRAMSNPVTSMDADDAFEMDNPQWVRERFVDPCPEGNTILRETVKQPDGTDTTLTRLYMPARLTDNPSKAFIESYTRTLSGLRPHIRRAYLEGDWYFVAGAFHSDEWEPNIHICDPFKIPKHWGRFRSMDWGRRKPGCVHWWAVSPEDELFCEKELTFQGKDAEQVAKMIRDVERTLDLWSTDTGDNGHSLVTGVSDNQLWEDRGSNAESMAQQMANVGVTWQKADKTSRQGNAAHFSKRLNAHGDGSNAPGIVFFRHCEKAIQTIPGIRTDPLNSECPADGGNDHWYDSVLYACAFASRDKSGMRPRDEHYRNHRGYKPMGGRYGYGSDVC